MRNFHRHVKKDHRRDHRDNRRPHHGQRPPKRHHQHRSPRPPQIDEAQQKFYAGTAIDPSPRVRLEEGSKELTMRVMDLICPIGMGQRGLIVSPPGSGKTTFLKHLCQAIDKCAPQAKMYCLLIDERPEEVTDFRRSVPAEVRWSSSDQSYDHHVETANQLMREVYREASEGADVVVLIDSLTRLSRVHNAEIRSGGRTMSGGVDARAMEVPRRVFGSARKVEEGGSLTILATILVETGSRMDELIFEEFKGTGNMEIVLSREIAGRRIFPAVDIAKSNTRKMELLLEPDELAGINKMRRVLAGLGRVEAASALIKQLEKYPTNAELLAIINNPESFRDS